MKPTPKEWTNEDAEGRSRGKLFIITDCLTCCFIYTVPNVIKIRQQKLRD